MNSYCLQKIEMLISIFDEIKEITEPHHLQSLDPFGVHNLFNSYLSGAKLLDLRNWNEYRSSHIHSAIHLDINDVSKASIPCDEHQTLICYGSPSISNNANYQKLRDYCREKKLCGELKFVDFAFDFKMFESEYPALCVSVEEEHVMRSNLRKRSRRFPNVIIPKQLFLGNEWNRRNVDGLKALGITHIVDVTESKFHDDGFKTLKIPIADTINAPIHQYFDDVVEFIDGALQIETNRVFVHCQMGVSRSSSMVMAYLMKGRGWTLFDSYRWCTSQRPKVHPNNGFFDALCQFEVRVHGKRTKERIKKEKLRQNPYFTKKSLDLMQFLGSHFMSKVDAQI